MKYYSFNSFSTILKRKNPPKLAGHTQTYGKPDLLVCGLSFVKP